MLQNAKPKPSSKKKPHSESLKGDPKAKVYSIKSARPEVRESCQSERF